MEFSLSRTISDEIEDIKVNDKKYKIRKGKVKKSFSNKFIDTLFIEINSLEELIEFQKDYGEIIITHNREDRTIKEIEIYDI